jgi:hypothetical protein
LAATKSQFILTKRTGFRQVYAVTGLHFFIKGDTSDPRALAEDFHLETSGGDVPEFYRRSLFLKSLVNDGVSFEAALWVCERGDAVTLETV